MLQKLSKSLQLIEGELGVLCDFGEGGALVGGASLKAEDFLAIARGVRD